MRLYSTITSERASKGQGGNDYLLIDIMDENRDKILQVHVTYAKSNIQGGYNVYIYNPKAQYIDISSLGFIEKGKK